MKSVSWHNNQDRETDTFNPYLMQVLERRTPSLGRVTAEEVLRAIAEKEDLFCNGLPRKVAQFVDDIFSFYYMGAAEYEFGSIPAALARLVAGPTVTREFLIEAKRLPKNFTRGNPYYDPRAVELERLRKTKATNAVTRNAKLSRIVELEAEIAAGPQNDLVLYYLGPEEYVEHMPALLDRMCQGKHRNKNGNHFGRIADPIDDGDSKFLGWLCLDYPFFLAKDEAAIKRLREVFR